MNGSGGAADQLLPPDWNVAYVLVEVLVALMAVVGNLLVLVAFGLDRRLRRLTNYYIASLAVADFLVGLFGVPFALLTSVGIPNNFHLCLFMLSLLIVLCTISILNLVAVSVDRFWAILFPMAYTRLMTKKAAKGIIVVCWILGAVIGFLPVIGWHAQTPSDGCMFVKMMDYNFLVFLYVFTIVIPSILMGGFYMRIYCLVIKQNRDVLQVRIQNSSQQPRDLMRIVDRKRDVNAAKNLFFIVIFFVLCWIPLYTINCIKAFCHSCQVPPSIMLSTIALSHVNSAGNPVLYACHLRDFREAMRCCLSCRRPGLRPNQRYRVSTAGSINFTNTVARKPSLARDGSLAGRLLDLSASKTS